MKAILDRVFARRDESGTDPDGTSVSSELTASDIEKYYLRIMIDVFRRLLVQGDGVELGVKRSGLARDGRPAYFGYVRLLKWDPLLSPVLLQNLPVIDARVRKIVAASVILEHTHFAGLWWQASSRIEGAPSELVGLPTELVVQPVPAG